MKRHHLFEFSDLAWWPELLRRLECDYLRAVSDHFRPFSVKVDLLADAIDSAEADGVVDFCSGGGGPWAHLAGELAQRMAKPVSVVLTDKFPDKWAALQAALPEGISYCPESIDAAAVPSRFRGLRTLFNGFHHFRPPQAQRILQDAVGSGQPIAVFEMLERSWVYFALLLWTPLLVVLMTPKTRPFRLSRLIFTFLIPILPICLLWDALVSVMRCYTPEEMLEMTARLEGPPYQWQAATYWCRGMPATYLIGHPVGQGSP